MTTFVRCLLATVGGLGLVLFAAGSMLPRDHVAQASRAFTASPEQVFTAITAFDRFPTWRSGVTRVDVDPSGNRYVEHGRDGAIPMKLLERVAPRRLVTEIDDPSLDFGGRWTMSVEAHSAGGSRLTITEHGFVPNPFFRVVAKYVFGHEMTMNTYLDDLARHVEKP